MQDQALQNRPGPSLTSSSHSQKANESFPVGLKTFWWGKGVCGPESFRVLNHAAGVVCAWMLKLKSLFQRVARGWKEVTWNGMGGVVCCRDGKGVCRVSTCMYVCGCTKVAP